MFFTSSTHKGRLKLRWNTTHNRFSPTAGDHVIPTLMTTVLCIQGSYYLNCLRVSLIGKYICLQVCKKSVTIKWIYTNTWKKSGSGGYNPPHLDTMYADTVYLQYMWTAICSLCMSSAHTGRMPWMQARIWAEQWCDIHGFHLWICFNFLTLRPLACSS